MLFMVISTPRPEKPSTVAASRRGFWKWFNPMLADGQAKWIYARPGRGAVALFDTCEGAAAAANSGGSSFARNSPCRRRHRNGSGRSAPRGGAARHCGRVQLERDCFSLSL